jgi:zona occludens toxin (predicted ATPase)
MIVLRTGTPGAGKSYHAVLSIKKDLKKGYIVVTNIEGIRKELFPNPENLILIHNDLTRKKELFFHYSEIKKFIERIRQKKGERKIIFYIDEAQRFLGRMKRLNQEIIYTFDYHRHLDCDFHLITQDRKKIHPDITVLAEYEIRAVRRSSQLLNRFKYKYMLDGEEFKKEVIKPDKKVFELYSSFDVKNAETKRYFAYTRLIMTIVLMFAVSIGSFEYLKYMFTPKKKTEATATEQPTKPKPKQKPKKNKQRKKKEKICRIKGSVIYSPEKNGIVFTDCGEIKINRGYASIKVKGKKFISVKHYSFFQKYNAFKIENRKIVGINLEENRSEQVSQNTKHQERNKDSFRQET